MNCYIYHILSSFKISYVAARNIMKASQLEEEDEEDGEITFGGQPVISKASKSKLFLQIYIFVLN